MAVEALLDATAVVPAASRITKDDDMAATSSHDESVAATVKEEETESAAAAGCAKPRRSRPRRRREPATEEEYLALCLVMLARGRRDVVHACSVCGKAFASHQALGGHKASHRKPPPAAPEEEQRPQVTAPAPPAAKPAAHECHVCGKTFPTGQALGGHKRCHYDGTIGSAAAGSKAGGGRVAPIGLIDLNLPEERCTAGAEEEDEVLSPMAFKKPRLMIPA